MLQDFTAWAEFSTLTLYFKWNYWGIFSEKHPALSKREIRKE